MNFVVTLMVTLWACTAAAAPFVTIHTKDGGTFRGELVERVPDDHVTLLLATGVAKRISTSDIEPRPPARRHVLASPAPTATVRTKDRSIFHGTLVERVVGDHVTILLESGETRRIDWADIDHGPTPHAVEPPRQPMVQVEVRADGRVMVGGIVEKVVGDHLTLMHDGDTETYPWGTFRFLGPPPATPHFHVSFRADDCCASLERYAHGTFEPVCQSPCTTTATAGDEYRVAGPNVTTSGRFRIVRDTYLLTTTGSRDRKTGGALLIALGSLALPIGLGFTAATTGPQSNPANGAVAGLLDVGAVALLAAGIYFVATSSTHVGVMPLP